MQMDMEKMDRSTPSVKGLLAVKSGHGYALLHQMTEMGACEIHMCLTRPGKRKTVTVLDHELCTYEQ
jgi:hypothetical protein